MNFVNKLLRDRFEILFNVCFVLAGLIVVIFFYDRIVLTSFLLIFITLIGLFKWRSFGSIFVFLFGALFGTLCEMIATSFGIWQYSVVSFFNIPFWLFILWGNTSLFLYRMGVEFGKLGIKK